MVDDKVGDVVDADDPGDGGADVDEVTDALLVASRIFVALAAQSVADPLADLTLPQFRVLVVLATRGPQNLGSLAAALEVNPSTASRLCERLVRRRLIRRQTSTADRREIRLTISPGGRDAYEHVMARRRERLATLVARLDEASRVHLLVALPALTAAFAAEADSQAPRSSLEWSVPSSEADSPASDPPVD